MVRLEHTKGFFSGVFRMGDANTYIYVDTTNKKIQVYIDGVKVHEWS